MRRRRPPRGLLAWLALATLGCSPTIGPVTAPPAMPTRPARPTVDQFEVTGWRIDPNANGRGSRISGEVRNNGEMPACLQFRVTVRGEGGKVVESKEWWWGTGNILAGESVSFETYIASPPTAKIELWSARAVDWNNPVGL
jgi:hypothetical protein